MPDKTDQHIANPEPKQVIRAEIAADGTITVPNCEAQLVSVDVADIDLLLGFADGTYVIIPNGALDALGDDMRRVVFADAEDAAFDQAHFNVDHQSSLDALFKMVGIADLAKAGSLRVVTEHVDADKTGQQSDFASSENIPADPSVDELVSKLRSVSGSGSAPASASQSLEPIPIDEPPPSVLPRPSVYSPGQKVESVSPDIQLDPNITADDVINIVESDPANTVTVTGTTRGSVVVGDTVVVEIGTFSATTQVLDDYSFSVDIPGDLFVTDADGSMMSEDGRLSPIGITATVTNAQGQTATSLESYFIDNEAPQPVILLDSSIAGDDIVNIQESAGDIVLTGHVAELTGSVNGPLAGDPITVTVGGQTFQGYVQPDGTTFSVKVPGSVLAPTPGVEGGYGILDVRIDTVDTAGNAAAAQQTGIVYGIDTAPPQPTIQLDPQIAGDGVVNLAESQGNVTISGTVGADAQAGDKVTLTVNGHDSIGTVYDDGSGVLRFDISVVGNDLRSAAAATLDGSVSATVESYDAAGNPGWTTDTVLYDLDVAPPSMTIVVDDAALKIGETSLVTIDFDAPVAGFDAGSLIVANGVLSNVTEVVAGQTWTATLTPDAPIESTSNLITFDIATVADAAGNPGVGTVKSNNYAIDTRAPVVESVEADDLLLSDADAGSVLSISVTFDEMMDTLVDPQLVFSESVLNTTLTSTGGSWNLAGTVYTETFTTGDVDVDFDSVTVDVNGAIDASGNPIADYTAEFEFEVDTLNPTVIIQDDNVDGVVSATDITVNYTLLFSEPVDAIDQVNDLYISGGTITTDLVLAADGLSATISLTAANESNDDLVLQLKSSVVDLNGNALVSNTSTLPVDTLNPRVTITPDNTDGVVSDSDRVVSYQLDFTKEVTSVTSDDLLVTGGVITSGPVLAADGLSATLVVTAFDNSNETLSVTVKDTIVDLSGRSVIQETLDLTVDTINPSVNLINDNTDGVVSLEDNVVNYTLAFSEVVQSVTASDLTIVGGTLTTDPVLSADGRTATFTVSVLDNTVNNLSVTVNDSILDVNGNQLISVVDTLPVDMMPPTGTVWVTKPILSSNDTTQNVLVTFTEPMNTSVYPTFIFSEDVSGVLNPVAGYWVNGGKTFLGVYSVLNVAVDIADITVTVEGIEDVNGNVLSGLTSTVSFDIDTIKPTALITNDNVDGVVSDSDIVVTYTVDFSEAVKTVDVTDLVVTGGTITSAPVLAADGLSATFVVTAYDESIEDIQVTLNNTIVDVNGNNLITASHAQTVDTVDYAPSFKYALYTPDVYKVTGGSGTPAGAYNPSASLFQNELIASPGVQATRERIDGTDLGDTIVHNGAFSAGSQQWTRVLHTNFYVIDEISSIVLTFDPAVAGIPNFNILGAGVVPTGPYTWTITPDAAMSADLILNGLDLNIVYDVAGAVVPIDFTAQLDVVGKATGVDYNLSDILDFTWREAANATDFDVVSAGGDQVMVLPSGGFGLDIYAGGGADTIEAGAGNDTIYGGSGGDYIDGGIGSDTVSFEGSTIGVVANIVAGVGSGGDAEGDTYVNIENIIGGDGDDTFIVGSAVNALEGGAGVDTVSYENSIVDISASLQSGSGTVGDAAGDSYLGIENLTGGAGNDTLVGDDGANVLMGGAGGDAMDGGAGNDTASFATAGSDVIAALDPGLGDFQAGDAAGDSFTNIENLVGSDWNDSLFGNTFDNILDGGAGNDRLYGSAGDDILYADQGSDVAVGDIGNDTLHASVDAANLANRLDGGAGNDTLVLHDMSLVAGTYDFTDLAGADTRLESLEVLDIREGSDASRANADSTIAITGQDVLNMVDTSVPPELTVLADSGDVLDLSAFTTAGETYVENIIASNHSEFVISDGGGSELARIQWHTA